MVPPRANWCTTRYELEGSWYHCLHYTSDGEARCFYCYQLLDTKRSSHLPFNALPYVVTEDEDVMTVMPGSISALNELPPGTILCSSVDAGRNIPPENLLVSWRKGLDGSWTYWKRNAPAASGKPLNIPPTDTQHMHNLSSWHVHRSSPYTIEEDPI